MQYKITTRILGNGLLLFALLLLQPPLHAQTGSGANPGDFEKKASEQYGRGYPEAQHSSEPASHVWEYISIAGSNSKITPAVARQNLGISLTGSMPLGKQTPQQIEFSELQAAAFDPNIMEQLFEKLGGEFFIGELSGPSTPAIELEGSTQAMPGLKFGLQLPRRFEFQASAQYFRNKWSGSFPVTVFPLDQGTSIPKTIQGNMTATATGVLATADLAYFVSTGKIQPFIAGGVRGQFPIQTDSGAEIDGVQLPLEIRPLSTRFSPFASVGLRVGLGKNSFAELGCSYGKIPGAGYAPALGAGIGWRF